MEGSKKRKRNEEVSFKRKKMKTKKDRDSMDPVPHKEVDNSESFTAELLSIQTIREGMLVLGCVTDVKATSVIVSLPGCLAGIIPANNISDVFTKHLTSFTDSSEADDIEPAIDSLIKVGMVFPCKVIEVVKDAPKGRPSITLSINPQDVNAELKPSSLYLKMVLFVTVCSLEDHGYIVDVGTKYIQGFLPKKHAKENDGEIKIGSVIPTYVKKIIHCDKLSAKIRLSYLDFTDDFPEVTATELKLPSLLPGARIEVDVIDIKHPFVFMKYLYFDACASLLSLDRTHQNVKVGTTITGTVLYVHPITHMIYVLLGSKPTPQIFARYFRLKRFETVANLKFQCVHKNRVYYKVKKGIYGFINTKDLAVKGCDASSISNDIPKACVVRFHYLDNLIQMSAQKAILEQPIVMPEDVKIGDIYEAVVKNHVQDGMFVCICPGLFGFVRRIHMSDVFVTKPELLHPTGSKVKCRVLSTDGNGKVNLTCKESLLNLQDQYILTSYNNAQKGQFYKGVIVQKADAYILVVFFNDVKGIVSTENIPEGSLFYEGQIVLCEVISSSPSKRKLKLSLQINDGWSTNEDTLDSMHSSKRKVSTADKKSMMSLSTNVEKANSKKPKEVKNANNTLSEKLCKTVDNVESNDHKPLKAIIKKVKGGQLNVVVNDSKGRVHITELGCVTEGVFPLREFSSGQEISVYVIGEYKKKRLLKITSRHIFLKECSLTFPPASSQILKPGASVIGFVKEVSDVSAVIWLSPTETGVLDFLHFTENLKVVKRVKRYLKAGLSLQVTILEKEKHANKRSGSQGFALTKIEKSMPEVGKNILGLVQIGCLDRGLILKLPFGYHGVAALTDLSDVYIPIQSLFDKCQKMQFVLCHILEVNHETKYCQVSLRKSRVYNKPITSDDSFCPEILSSTLKEGDTVKGFVKSVSNTALNVVFGRNLEGKVTIHNCSVSGCKACIASENICAKYPTGSVIKVDVEKMDVNEKSFNLMLTNSKNKVNSRNNRLSIKEDISWDDIE